MSVSSHLSFLHSQLFVEPKVPQTDYTGQTVIVTGANKGLGLEAARHLLRLNAARVILAVRSVSNGNAAKKDLEASTGRSGAVQVLQLDMSSHESVKRFSEEVAKVDRIDAALLNAGIFTQDFELVDGHESTITVNVVNTFLLALLLLPLLRKSAKTWNTAPRITIVSSDRHVMTNLPEWKSDNTYKRLTEDKSTMPDRYFASKLMQILLARAMAERVPDVVINSLTPGYCTSELTSKAHGVTKLAFWLLAKATARTTEVGSRVLVSAVSMGKESHGKYINDGKIQDSALSPFVRSKEGHDAQEKIWGELLDILKQWSFDVDIRN